MKKYNYLQVIPNQTGTFFKVFWRYNVLRTDKGKLINQHYDRLAFVANNPKQVSQRIKKFIENHPDCTGIDFEKTETNCPAGREAEIWLMPHKQT